MLVLGGGPAGATAALRLARLGHRVHLVERADGSPAAAVQAHLAESLPARLRPLFANLGVLDRVDQAGFLEPHPPQVDWPGLPHAAAPGPAPAPGEAPGWLVDRLQLAALLRAAAWRAGAQQVAGHAETPERHAGGWRVALRERGGGLSTLTADFVLDARGRRAGPATAPATAALLALWHPGRDTAAVEPCLRIQAGRSGWVWASPLPGGALNVGVFVDGKQLAGRTAAARSRLYHAVLGEATLLAPLLDTRCAGPLCIGDATARCSPDAAPSPGLLRIGDAAVSLDPLSSQGVQVALRSAMQAAACVHTAWHRPRDAEGVWDFHRQQSARVARRHAAWGQAFYAAAATAWPHPFWSRRARAASPTPSVATSPDRSGARPWPSLDARIALMDDAQLVQEPVLDGDWIVERPVLQLGTGETSAAYLAGFLITDWLRPLLQCPTPVLADLLDHWRQRFGAVRTEAAFAHLWQQNLLRQAPGAGHARAMR